MRRPARAIAAPGENLNFGAISDGQFLKRQGGEIVGTAAPEGGGPHTHAISEVAGLQTALDSKGTSNFSGSYPDLSNKPTIPSTKADIGLGNADNTADSAKPVSTAQQTALDMKAPLANPTFTGNITFTGTIVTDTTTGLRIGGSGTQKLGFFGVTPVVRPSAFTQTYSTASKTHANVTQLAAPAGGTGTAAGGWSTAANRDLAITSINAARNDIANIKQVLNALIDDLQAEGLIQ